MASTGCAIVVEGYTDVIALHEAGVTNVVATLGTALTMRHIRVLAKHAPKKIVYLFDGDAAGQKAADRAWPSSARASPTRTATPWSSWPSPCRTTRIRPSSCKQKARKPWRRWWKGRCRSSSSASNGASTASTWTRRPAAIARWTRAGGARPIKDTLVAKDYAVRTWSRLRAMAVSASRRPTCWSGWRPWRCPAAPARRRPPPKLPCPGPRRALSQAERNRLRFEREFLALACQHPLVGLAHADAGPGAVARGGAPASRRERAGDPLREPGRRTGRHRHEGDARHAPCCRACSPPGRPIRRAPRRPSAPTWPRSWP